MNLTEDQILALAPDEASKKAGKDLATVAKWSVKGHSREVAWGECQGSGSKPYQTVIDLISIAFKCSCPSRKFPCKHGIALGLLLVKHATSFSNAELPLWAKEWIEKRAAKEETKPREKQQVNDATGKEKRQSARINKVQDGVAELLVWIKDIVRNGIMTVPDKGYQFWEGMSRRMIDSQAPGLSNMIRKLGAINFFKEGWQSTFLDSLLSIYLIAKGFQNSPSLSPLLTQDIRNWIGFTTNQDELKEQAGVMDIWLVAGKQLIVDDNLTTEQFWLYGTQSKEFALILQFIVRGQGGNLLLSPGTFIEAELVYFPSIAPLRAIIKRHVSAKTSTSFAKQSSWKEVGDEETKSCSLFPVRNEKAYAVSQLLPVLFNNQWWLKDRNDNLMMMNENFTGLWKLLALSGGQPLDMIVIGKEAAYLPLGIWSQHLYKAL